MFTNQRFADAVSNAKKRGVTVRIIADSSMIGSSGSQINLLQGAGWYTKNDIKLIGIVEDIKYMDN